MDEGVTKVAEMKRHIKSFSKKDLGNTSTQNRRFYPLDKDIRNVMDSYKNQTRFSKDDKENLELLLEEYKSVNDKDSFYLKLISLKLKISYLLAKQNGKKDYSICMVKKSVCWMQPIKQQNMTCQHSLCVLTLMLVTPLLAASLLQMKQRIQ